MAEATAMHSAGAELFFADYTDAAPTQYSDFAAWQEMEEVLSMSGVGSDFTVTRITFLKSEDKAHEKVPGFRDSGQVTFRMNYSSLIMLELQNWIPGDDGIPDVPPAWGRFRWALVLPDHGVWEGKGFIKSQPIENPEDDRDTVEVTIEISGKPTWHVFA